MVSWVGCLTGGMVRWASKRSWKIAPWQCSSWWPHCLNPSLPVPLCLSLPITLLFLCLSLSAYPSLQLSGCMTLGLITYSGGQVAILFELLHHWIEHGMDHSNATLATALGQDKVLSLPISLSAYPSLCLSLPISLSCFCLSISRVSVYLGLSLFSHRAV